MPLVKLPSAWFPMRCDHQRGRKALAASRATSATPRATSTVTGRVPRSSGSDDGESDDAIGTSLSRNAKKILHGSREHELEGAAACRGWRTVAGLPEAGALIELLSRLVRLLDEEHDGGRVSISRPFCNR